MALSFFNTKFVVGHDFARSPHSMLLDKRILTNHHKCIIWYCEEASSQEYERFMQLIGNIEAQ